MTPSRAGQEGEWGRGGEEEEEEEKETLARLLKKKGKKRGKAASELQRWQARQCLEPARKLKTVGGRWGRGHFHVAVAFLTQQSAVAFAQLCVSECVLHGAASFIKP